MDLLTSGNTLLAACNSAQGRVQSILWTIERSEGIVLILARAMVEATLVRLRKYVLRAKVSLESSADQFQVGVLGADQLPAMVDLSGDRTHQQLGSISYLRMSGHRQIMIVGPTASMLDPVADVETHWRTDHLRAGYPQIFPATHEHFVAQMLNLDLLGGISFEKGCYTGQEIIARTHFRGAVKRRMFRYTAVCPPPPAGTRLLASDQHAGDVVDAIASDAGCELLAVVTLAQADAALTLEPASGITLRKLSLPYEVM
jgi:hypothetical protein